MNNKQNISACKRGERNAQEQLFKQFAPYVFTICRRYHANNEDAREAMQDSFIRIYDKLHKYDEAKGNLKSWVAKLSVNICLNRLRANANVVLMKSTQLTDIHLNTLAEAEQETDPKKEMLFKAIQKLPSGFRQVLNLYIFEQKKHKEIAQMLQISETTSRSQLARAKAQLKEIIENNKISSYGT